MAHRNPRRSHSGISLVEMLVVIAIIGILTSLLLVAIPAVRESARRTACANNVKQLSLGAILHEETHGFFPTGGWGADWMGDPDRGFGQTQPGGWIYNILPYIEESAIRELGKGQSKRATSEMLVRVLQSPVGVMNCPDRRTPDLFPYTGPPQLKNVTPPTLVAKSDYAINEVVSFARSETNSADVKTGMGKTIMIGEKSMDRRLYEEGTGDGDKLTMYVGDSSDIRRSPGQVVSDRNANSTSFGSAHPSGCNLGYGDGSVRFKVFGE